MLICNTQSIVQIPHTEDSLPLLGGIIGEMERLGITLCAEKYPKRKEIPGGGVSALPFAEHTANGTRWAGN